MLLDMSPYRTEQEQYAAVWSAIGEKRILLVNSGAIRDKVSLLVGGPVADLLLHGRLKVQKRDYPSGCTFLFYKQYLRFYLSTVRYKELYLISSLGFIQITLQNLNCEGYSSWFNRRVDMEVPRVNNDYPEFLSACAFRLKGDENRFDAQEGF